ncbi:hypothetical protein G195_011630 [Phytophthora kernoviae 00238/432]|uniref:Tc3 transposase DNA binding domain-containing protein n=1 Tax=Phytophthora kernoviae 00238/432 TaxID=1284355 RepID=A0A8J4VZE6_9STRA|nr:hypothetical protein G195_011630 [Phytophthora kernoviae 00238/432]
MGATELTPDERKSIIILHDAGLKLSAISVATHRSIGVCHKAIKMRDTPSKPSRRGKPKKVSERDKRSIIRAMAGPELLPRHQMARKKWGDDHEGKTNAEWAAVL